MRGSNADVIVIETMTDLMETKADGSCGKGKFRQACNVYNDI
ncbi:MAG: hypothetical protein ACLR1A_03450 [Eubacterium ventriosum]